MKEFLSDLTILTYAFVLLVAVYSFIVFAYWAIKSRGVASAWYYYVMGLILSSIISTGFLFWARIYYLLNKKVFIELLSSNLWAIRLWLGAAVTTAIAIHATRKLFRNKGRR